MGRHRTAQEREDLRAAAITLRIAGATYDVIAHELALSKSTCSLWLRAVQVEPDTHRQPDAAVGSRAYALREQGQTLVAIAAALGITVSEAADQVAHLPNPFERSGEDKRAHTDRQRERYYADLLHRREGERALLKASHAARVGSLTPRELEIAAVVAYWSEGTKDKPYERRERITFINSDPGLVLLFAAWLDATGVDRADWALCLSIHDSADVVAATRFWAEVLGVEEKAFTAPWLKHHRPGTLRKNTGEAYVGCLVLRVRGSRLLYQRVAGVWNGIVGGLTDWQDGGAAQSQRGSSALV